MFPPPLSRTRTVAPGVLMLVACLVAGSFFPLVAKDGEPDYLPKYSACVGSALESAGFRDLTGFSDEAEDAINCLAHYRITEGTTRSSFSPKNSVTRGQMAVFLARAAVPAGIELPEPSHRGFTDIGGLPWTFRDAIDQLAELGITTGKTATTYAPGAMVTRRQMVNFLYRFLDLVPVGPGGVDIEDVDPDDELFEDIDVLPIADHRAVRVLYEMGIIRGISPSRFSPGDYVSRAQMAAFITRMLAHTKARPAGLALQTEDTVATEGRDTEIMVSVRDRYRRPVPDAAVDFFYASTSADTFSDNGYCDDDVVIGVLGDDPCEIDIDDETTDEDGNLIYDVPIDKELILWAWTGGLGDNFNLDRTDYDSLFFTTKKGAVAFQLTDDMAAGASMVRYGNSVTFTFQLVDDEGDPVYEEDVEIMVRSEEETDTELIRRRTREGTTNDSGRVHLTFHISRPRSADVGEKVYLSLEILDSSGYRVIDETTTMILGSNARLAWDNADEVASALLLEQRANYQIATSEGSGAWNSVVATLVDQYGDPVRGETVHFVSDDPNGLGRDDDPTMAKPDHREETNRRGQATVRYNRDHSQASTERIEAFTEGSPRVATDPAEPLEHYWVEEVPEDQTFDLEVLIHEEDRRTLVLGGSGQGPFVVTYDSNDQFNHDGAREAFDSFSEELEEGDDVEVQVEGHHPSEVNSFTRRR